MDIKFSKPCDEKKEITLYDLREIMILFILENSTNQRRYNVETLIHESNGVVVFTFPKANSNWSKSIALLIFLINMYDFSYTDHDYHSNKITARILYGGTIERLYNHIEANMNVSVTISK